MDKIKINLKECCLTCEHFYLDTMRIGCYVSCEPEERRIECVHMPVCYKYRMDEEEKSGMFCFDDGGNINDI